MSAVYIKQKPGESVDRLIARFKKATSVDVEEMKTKKGFVSKTEERLEAKKEKFRKIRRMKRELEEGR